MNFILSGIETKNKGAELMLYAILQEIEKKFRRRGTGSAKKFISAVLGEDVKKVIKKVIH